MMVDRPLVAGYRRGARADRRRLAGRCRVGSARCYACLIAAGLIGSGVRDTVDDVSSVAGDSEPIVPVVVLSRVRRQPGPTCGCSAGEEAGRARPREGRRRSVSKQHATVRFERGAWTIPIAAAATARSSTANGSPARSARTARRSCASATRCSCSSPTAAATAMRSPTSGDHVVGPELARLYTQVQRARHERHPARPRRERLGQGAGRARLYPQRGPARATGRSSPSTAPRSPRASPSACCSARARARSRARPDAAGYLQSADGGTLFLDEIARPRSRRAGQAAARARDARGDAGRCARAGEVDIGSSPRATASCAPRSPARRFREDLYYRLARAVGGRCRRCARASSTSRASSSASSPRSIAALGAHAPPDRDLLRAAVAGQRARAARRDSPGGARRARRRPRRRASRGPSPPARGHAALANRRRQRRSAPRCREPRSSRVLARARRRRAAWSARPRARSACTARSSTG